ncbi:helix-turn-helix domain-containing protein [Camelimonas sp. ID_303_24]
MAAQLLFAHHGLNAVTVQQIVAAAGQKSNAAIHYHFGSKEELENEPQWRGYMRFTSHLHATNREALARALDNRWNSAHVACFDQLKKMIKVASELLYQRLFLLNIYANTAMSARDAALEDSETAQDRLWGQRFTLENILDSLEAALISAPSQSTRRLL